MTNSKKTTKLQLRKDTLRTLGGASLARVNGGAWTYYYNNVLEFYTLSNCGEWQDKDGDSSVGVRG